MSISYSEEKSIEECRSIIRAKPFSPCFEDQVETAESLYGVQFKVCFTQEDIHRILEKASSKKIYSSKIIERVENILLKQLRMKM